MDGVENVSHRPTYINAVDRPAARCFLRRSIQPREPVLARRKSLYQVRASDRRTRQTMCMEIGGEQSEQLRPSADWRGRRRSRAEHLHCADQRIIEAEQLLSRLAILALDRRAWGLSTGRTEALSRRITGLLVDWTIHREQLAEALTLGEISSRAGPGDLRPEPNKRT
jgi:hypothetical protein